ncbi:MAG: phosphatidylcholine/phosphatidylserine synthase [Rhodobacteraceae bacterium]|nr:phosphatidylcholine/phosphatidylserine synthase [Paracoccaceae bacterium]
MNTQTGITLRHVLPSIVTALAICAGMVSVRMSLEGDIEMALCFILLAVFLDAADGKLARFLDVASPFGAELDTLADFFNFGIVPGILLYNTLYIGTEYDWLGFTAILVLAVCCALRLARFNLVMKSAGADPKKDDHFIGVPAPALACLALMPIFMHLHGWHQTELPVARAAYIIGVGLLAVSTIPTVSIKHASIRRGHFPVAIVLALALAICLAVFPWPTLIAGNVCYLASLPFSYLAQVKHTKAMQETHVQSVD